MVQGQIPTPVQHLDNLAMDAGKMCTRYYVLSPMAEMMCTDGEGRIVATNIRSLAMVGV